MLRPAKCSARVWREDRPFPTLVECYSKQHLLPAHTLESKGVFAEIARDDQDFKFHCPTMWVSLLGNHSSLLMPDMVQSIYEQLGSTW